MGVEKLNMKGVDVYKRNFVEIIISISYFRVPEFREKFLGIILEKSNGTIEEWRNTEGFLLDRSNGGVQSGGNPVATGTDSLANGGFATHAI